MLSLGKHHCRALQNIWAKHTPDEFSFKMLARCTSAERALDHEQYALNYHFGRRLCLNGSPLARMPILSEGSRVKAKVAISTSERYKQVHREVCQKRNADPKFQEFAADALRNSEKFKEARRLHQHVLQRPDVIAKNRAAIIASGKQSAVAREQARILNSDSAIKAKNLLATSKVVEGTHQNTGAVVRFPSQSAAARSVGVYPSNISMACAGKAGAIKGYVWRIVKQQRRI